jgi:hypothetical protein
MTDDRAEKSLMYKALNPFDDIILTLQFKLKMQVESYGFLGKFKPTYCMQSLHELCLIRLNPMNSLTLLPSLKNDF